jgi:hypothetical protein
MVTIPTDKDDEDMRRRTGYHIPIHLSRPEMIKINKLTLGENVLCVVIEFPHHVQHHVISVELNNIL